MSENDMNLGCFRDKTYCASPQCKNDCGRDIIQEINRTLQDSKYSRISYAYLCGKPCTHEFESSSFLVTICTLCGEIKNE
jgi:hypothetical protein